jgi:FKBP-type peptidyl-prolyl cis-trans isomerase FkpA
MTRISSLLLSFALLAGALAATGASAAAPAAAPPATGAAPASPAKDAKDAKGTSGAAMSEADKAVYAIGVILSGSVKPFALTEHEMRLVRDGFDAGLHGKNTGDVEKYRPQIQALLAERMGKEIAAAKAAGQTYREQAAKAKDTTTLPSGVIMTTVKAGSGPSPTADDQVKVNYEGRLIDGTVFDASAQHGAPLTFKVSGVVPCWSEALQKMNVGAKIKLVCPPEQAYGDRGSPPRIPGGSTLVFDVELLAIEKAPAEPQSPADAGKPDERAKPDAPAQPDAPANPR